MTTHPSAKALYVPAPAHHASRETEPPVIAQAVAALALLLVPFAWAAILGAAA